MLYFYLFWSVVLFRLININRFFFLIPHQQARSGFISTHWPWELFATTNHLLPHRLCQLVFRALMKNFAIISWIALSRYITRTHIYFCFLVAFIRICCCCICKLLFLLVCKICRTRINRISITGLASQVSHSSPTNRPQIWSTNYSPHQTHHLHHHRKIHSILGSRWLDLLCFCWMRNILSSGDED